MDLNIFTDIFRKNVKAKGERLLLRKNIKFTSQKKLLLCMITDATGKLKIFFSSKMFDCSSFRNLITQHKIKSDNTASNINFVFLENN